MLIRETWRDRFEYICSVMTGSVDSNHGGENKPHPRHEGAAGVSSYLSPVCNGLLPVVK